MKIKFLQFIMILFSMFINSSCNRVLMKIMGIKKPHLETKVSLTKYMGQHRIDSTITLIAKDTTSFEKLNTYLNGQASILIYNKDGFLNIYADKRYCAGPVENYVGKICTASVLGVDSTKTEKYLLSLLKPFTGNDSDSTSTKPDYSIYLTWTRWENKMNESVFRWRDLIAKQNNCKIMIHYINNDQRAEDYGFNKRQRMSVSTHRNRHHQ